MKNTAIEVIAEQQRAQLTAVLNTAMGPTIAQHQRIMSEISGSLIPNIDHLIPKLNVSGLLPTAGVLGPVIGPDLSWIKSLNQEMVADLLPKIAVPTFHVPLVPLFDIRLFDGLLDVIRGADWARLIRRIGVPSNWPDEFDDVLPQLVEIVNGEGIPVAWVPRTSILEALIVAESATARSELLIAHRDEILQDCMGSVENLDDAFLAPYLPIAKEVLTVCHGGHWAVGAIAAVTLVHNLVEALRWVSDHQRVAKYHSLREDESASRLLEQATRAPLIRFYDDWNPKSGQPRPAHLTRHVVSHQLDEDQVSARNCVVAVMLMASLLVTVEQLELGRDGVAA
jgi:hypothetical protein